MHKIVRAWCMNFYLEEPHVNYCTVLFATFLLPEYLFMAPNTLRVTGTSASQRRALPAAPGPGLGPGAQRRIILTRCTP